MARLYNIFRAMARLYNFRDTARFHHFHDLARLYNFDFTPYSASGSAAIGRAGSDWG